MSQPNKKPCLQERIKEKAKVGLQKLLFHPVPLFIFCFIIFLLPTSLYIRNLEALEYPRVSDLVELIVRTGGVLIAFSGVIASMIMGKFLEETERLKAQAFESHKQKRHRIISFIGTILLTLVASIFFGFWSIILKNPVYTIVVSIILLFTGVVELFAMLVYSIEFGPIIRGPII